MSTLSIKRLSLLSLSSTTIVLLYLQCSSLLLLSSSTTMAMESIIPNDLIVTRCKQNCPQQLYISIHSHIFERLNHSFDLMVHSNLGTQQKPYKCFLPRPYQDIVPVQSVTIVPTSLAL
ncbi:hypothetical protein BLOT_014704 [Blomia tropicalis]|nr:hypothetical protein BLOT_014704 [Blomia tropicalis]